MQGASTPKTLEIVQRDEISGSDNEIEDYEVTVMGDLERRTFTVQAHDRNEALRAARELAAPGEIVINVLPRAGYWPEGDDE